VITLKDGRRLEQRVEHAVGSVERPMTDADLDAKVRNLCDGVLPAARTRRLIDLCRNIEREAQARVIAEVARV
jgi:2-methylcitrate dehydratase PrpD